MSHALDSKRRFWLLVLTVIALCVLAFPSVHRAQTQPKTKSYIQTTWLVEIDFRHVDPNKLKETPTYKFSIVAPASGGCPYPLPTGSSTTLNICQGDIVQFAVHTNQKKAHLRIFQKDKIFLDANGNKTERLDGDEVNNANGPTDPGIITGTYEYCVAAVDPQENNHLYIHDPQIIIGTGDNLKKYLHKHPNTQ